MPKVIRDEAEAKRWGLSLLIGGYLLHLAAALGIPSQPWVGTAFWFVAAIGAILYTFIVLRQTLRNYRGRKPPQ